MEIKILALLLSTLKRKRTCESCEQAPMETIKEGAQLCMLSCSSVLPSLIPSP